MEPFEFLKQNSEDMATVVETYLVEETASLIYSNEDLEKWNALVSELGLKGQDVIRAPEKSPVPFLIMNETMKSIFETLCPTKTPVEDYNQMPIPIEILSLVSLSKKENYFSRIQIWYDEKVKDPVCVGVNCQWGIVGKIGGFVETGLHSKQEAEQKIVSDNLEGCSPYEITWNAKYWILGRWADVKQSFEELRIRAKERYIGEQRNQKQLEINKLKRELDDLELEANNKFGV